MYYLGTSSAHAVVKGSRVFFTRNWVQGVQDADSSSYRLDIHQLYSLRLVLR